jgi:hypothetical protein
MGYPIAGWFISGKIHGKSMENPTQMDDDWGYTPILGKKTKW